VRCFRLNCSFSDARVCEFRSGFLMGPGNSRGDRSPNAYDRAWRVSELSVLRLKKVLPVYGELEVSVAPAETNVRRAVRTHVLVRQSTHIAIGQIGFKSLGQIEQGLNNDSVVRAGSVVHGHSRGILRPQLVLG
jgi:hypothetical protein